MSKILNVSIINKNTLILEEDAQKGDKIDLLSLNNVDLSNIEKQIEAGVDAVYNRKLKEKEEALSAANKLTLENAKLAITNEYESKITELQTKLNTQETTIESKYTLKVKELEQEIISLKRQFELDKQEEINKITAEKDKIINDLTRSKFGTNVKRIGERLEHWCENEFEEHSMNGFVNCTFEKDNVSIK